jgi:hypothetical protein
LWYVTNVSEKVSTSIFRIDAGIILQDKENNRTGTGTTEEQTINDGIEWGGGGVFWARSV